MARGDKSTGGADKSTDRLFCEGERPFDPELPAPPDDVTATPCNQSRAQRNVLAANLIIRRNSAGNGGNGEQSQICDFDYSNDGGPTPYEFGPGTADFAIEAWIKRNYPDSISTWQTDAASAAGYGVTGLGLSGAGAFPVAWGPTLVGLAAGFQFRGSVFEAVYQHPTGSVSTRITGTLPLGWAHIVINFDRSGNMELFINGVSQGTAACSTTSFTASVGFHVLACDYEEANAESGKVEAPYRIASWALHSGAGSLLTAAEIADSFRNNSLQSMGTSLTQVRMSVNSIRLMLGVNQEWTDAVANNEEFTQGYWDTPRASTYSYPTQGVDASLDHHLAPVVAEYDETVCQISQDLITVPEGNENQAGYWGLIKDTSGNNNHYHIHGVNDVTEEGMPAYSGGYITDPTWPPSQGAAETPYA